MNPEKFAQFFYESRCFEAVDNVSKKSKNINMEMRHSSTKPFQKMVLNHKSPYGNQMIVEEDSKLEV